MTVGDEQDSFMTEHFTFDSFSCSSHFFFHHCSHFGMLLLAVYFLLTRSSLISLYATCPILLYANHVFLKQWKKHIWCEHFLDKKKSTKKSIIWMIDVFQVFIAMTFRSFSQKSKTMNDDYWYILSWAAAQNLKEEKPIYLFIKKASRAIEIY